jgi:hypothetical protein
MAFRFPNASFPTGRDARTPAKRLIANSLTTNLFIVAPSQIVESGLRVSQHNSLVGANTLVQATAGNQPLFFSTVAQANGRPAMAFGRSRPDRLDLTTRPTTTGAFSMAVAYVPSLVVAESQGIFGNIPSSTSRIGFFQTASSTTLFAAVGTGLRQATPTLGEPTLAILGKDASNFALRMNGTTGTSTAHNEQTNSTPFVVGDTTSAGLLPGQFWFMLAATFNGNILDGSAAANEALDALEDYCRSAYGIGA